MIASTRWVDEEPIQVTGIPRASPQGDRARRARRNRLGGRFRPPIDTVRKAMVGMSLSEFNPGLMSTIIHRLALGPPSMTPPGMGGFD